MDDATVLLMAEVIAAHNLIAAVIAHSSDREGILTTFQLRISAYSDSKGGIKTMTEERGSAFPDGFIGHLERASATLVRLVDATSDARPWTPPRP